MRALDDRRRAGSKLLPSALVEYYRPHLEDMTRSGVFEPLGRPRRGEWLAEQAESGQTLAAFVRSPFKAAPHGGCDSVALVPLGDAWDFPSLGMLADYVSAFYAVPVVVAPHVPLEVLIAKVEQRVGMDQQRQFLAQDLLHVMQDVIKSDRKLMCKCVAHIGVTVEDLYHRDDWNFVFGLAESMEGVGVFSFHRYDPGPDLDPMQRQALSMHRACKVMTHELGHLFGLKHCVFFRCLMNGSNHLEELDGNGLFLCPICLAKLLDSFSWDLAERNRGLMKTSRELDFMSAAELEQLDEFQNGTEAFQAFVGSTPLAAVNWHQPRTKRSVLA